MPSRIAASLGSSPIAESTRSKVYCHGGRSRPIRKSERYRDRIEVRKISHSVQQLKKAHSQAHAPQKQLKGISARQTDSPKIALSNGRQYTHSVEFSSGRAKKIFKKFWGSVEKPTQNRKFVERCKAYFALMKKTGQDPALRWVEVAQSEDPDLGMGLRAKKNIPEGTLIGHYAGIMKRMRSYSDSAYIFSFNGVELKDWSLDAAEKGNVLSCVNGNEETPNILVHEYYDAEEGPRIIFIADKNIPKGKELFISYGEDYWNHISINPKRVSS